MNIKHPDYDKSILSLTASVLKHYSADSHHKSLPLLDEALAKDYKNVVVMLFDGMGISIINKHLEREGFFRSHITSEISSVFPPTTTAATTTIETGASPAEHSWLGWSLYFKELDTNVNIFSKTFQGSNGAPAAEYNVVNRYLPATRIFEKIKTATGGKVNAVCVSPFTEYQVQNVSEIRSTVEKLCKQDWKNYIYTYWPQPDSDMHKLGVEGEGIKECIRNIESEIETMCANLKDTLVIVTADHGMIDVENKYLTDYPEILECLLRAPSVEPRAMSLFIKEGYQAVFEKAFMDAFGNNYILLKKEEVFEQNLFGYGDLHPRTKGFNGNYLAVATGSVNLELKVSDFRSPHKATHAGLTEDEMIVPLIMIDCK